jgi:hypothetical protein
LTIAAHTLLVELQTAGADRVHEMRLGTAVEVAQAPVGQLRLRPTIEQISE